MHYITTHTPNFTIGVDLAGENSSDYTIISTVEITKDYGIPVIIADNELNPMEYCYAEGYHIWDIYTKRDDDWIGINHYRRYLTDVPKGQTVLPEPMYFNLHHQYAQCHRISDLILCERIIDDYFPFYSIEYEKIDLLYPCNMFVMCREDFSRYCEFVFGVLQVYNEKMDFKTYYDVQESVRFMFPNNNVYQSRIHGFLMERLGTIFFIKNFSKGQFITRPIHITGKKQTFR